MLEMYNFAPKVFSRSRDYQVLLKLFEIVACVTKSDADNMINLLSADKCPDHMLPLLASYVGYEYDYNQSYDANRTIIRYYPQLIRNRGSERGIRLAAALSVNAIGAIDDIELLSLFKIEYVEKDGKINVYIYYPNYMSKIRDLIEVVRPAGVRVELIPAEPIVSEEKIQLKDYFSVDQIETYKNSNRYKVEPNNNDKTPNRVGFGQVAKGEEG